MRPFDRVIVEPVAIGSTDGTAEFYMSSYSTLSTLSTEWLSIAQKAERFSGMEWNEKILVPVSTLDALIERHGMPQFTKIDVEGFEKEVLVGLSQASKHLAFEFNTEFIDAAVECLSAKCFPSDTKFNLTLGSQTEYASHWMDRSEMARHLQGLTGMQAYGDIIACRD
jgi:FkbM family methyltransferase